MHPRVSGALQALLARAGVSLRRLPDVSHGARPRSLDEAHLAGARLLPDRDHLLPLVATGSRVVEVGVGFGDFSRKILDVVRPREFVAIDKFQLHDKPRWPAAAADRGFDAASHEAFYRNRFRREIDAGILEIRKGLSDAVLEGLPDDHFDFIYIDAGHRHASVRRDVEAARRKIRPGGLMAFDDYERADPLGSIVYGVKHAAHELCIADGWKVVYVALEGAESAANLVLQRPLR
jgi:SAM-dependent methyltransferase